ncbi:hypothetical protein PCASD_14236 [Puccinia coronata f. sp. avenae]|uniref:Uncharacterized protein n=1 Tax=Puccinia coronata f. sp. avenae TaxID=200324 RepID=A0A2N5UB55_9BASI|nr:hypothetical protein PCASD_14236 [Puccinia coronata f. sp. avenae]
MPAGWTGLSNQFPAGTSHHQLGTDWADPFDRLAGALVGPCLSNHQSSTAVQALLEQPCLTVQLTWGLIAARPKGVRTPPQTPKKKACGGCTPSQPGVQTPARPPPHAARRPHAYKWREDGRLGVRPRRTGVLAMHACLEGVQALHALRTGVHGWHACPARLT